MLSVATTFTILSSWAFQLTRNDPVRISITDMFPVEVPEATHFLSSLTAIDLILPKIDESSYVTFHSATSFAEESRRSTKIEYYNGSHCVSFKQQYLSLLIQRKCLVESVQNYRNSALKDAIKSLIFIVPVLPSQNED